MMTRTMSRATIVEGDALHPPKEASAIREKLPHDTSILFLIDQLTELGGGERAAFQLAQELSKAGIKVTVVTFRGNPNPGAFKLFSAITIMPLASCFSLRAIQVACRLLRHIRQNKVNLVQTFFESADTFGATVAKFSGVPCIISSRRDMGILRSTKHRIAYRIVSCFYSKVICVSDQVRNWHRREDHLREELVLTIHNGTKTGEVEDTSRLSGLREKLGIPPDVPVVVTVANINPWKGVDVFIECAALVLKTQASAVFAVAGDWTDVALVDALHERVIELGISDHVFFLGRVEDICGLLQMSDVFALLSRTEGFPNVVIEAMAASLPVVATAVGGTPEAVVDGVTGFLVESGDSAMAAQHICRLLGDPELKCRVGALGRKRVKEYFSIQQMVWKHVEVYDAVLRSQR